MFQPPFETARDPVKNQTDLDRDQTHVEQVISDDSFKFNSELKMVEGLIPSPVKLHLVQVSETIWTPKTQSAKEPDSQLSTPVEIKSKQISETPKVRNKSKNK